MPKNIILFCGVESTGKSTTISLLENYLKEKKIKCKVISEYGRDVCFESGGVDEMNLYDYEKILLGHQQNIIERSNDEYDIILLDTDSLYTSYYLEKDKELFNQNIEASKMIVNIANSIAMLNKNNNRILKVIYLNSNCPFVQDGTRTYESTRKDDDIYLFNRYKTIYGDNLIEVISDSDFNDRYNKIKEIVNDLMWR